MRRHSPSLYVLAPLLMVSLSACKTTAGGGGGGADAATVKADLAPSGPLWEDATPLNLRSVREWSHRVETADLNGDGRLDLLFADGGQHHTKGVAETCRVFFNTGNDSKGTPQFQDVTAQVLGTAKGSSRAIKARDVNDDGLIDIIIGGNYSTESRLLLAFRVEGENGAPGAIQFKDVSATNLPRGPHSIGDLELGDVDGDGDLDITATDAGPGDLSRNAGGRTMLWLNDGKGVFTDATAAKMPDVNVRWSWDHELLDIDNDLDLDLMISCKACNQNFVFINDGKGNFKDESGPEFRRLPAEPRPTGFANNYDFEPLDVDGDGFFDVVTLNDGVEDNTSQSGLPFRQHLYMNDRKGHFTETGPLADKDNVGSDNNLNVVLDADSDGDSDYIIGSLDGEDRLLVNDRGTSPRLRLRPGAIKAVPTQGTLGMLAADINGDGRIDLVESQGEVAFGERIYLGKAVPPDTAKPVIMSVETITAARLDRPVAIRARIHDGTVPVQAHQFKKVVLVFTDESGAPKELPLRWIGEFYWRADVTPSVAGTATYHVCATDAAGNEACSEDLSLTVQ
jgi:hypothetical protein